MSIEQAAADYANFFIQAEYKRQQELNPERFARASQEMKAEFEAGWHDTAIVLAMAIRTKTDPFVSKAAQGMLHPSNGNSRRLFTAITGLALPSTVGGTDKVLAEYAGAELAAYQAAKQGERDAKEQAAQAKEQAAQADRIGRIIERVKQGNTVMADELIDLVRHLGIEVHPRTIGAIRKHVIEVGPGGARVYKHKTRAPQSMYTVYRQCREALQETVAAA